MISLWTIPDSVIFCIASIQMSWKDITDIQQSASHLDLYLDIDNIERLQTKLYDKRDDFTFPIVNFPFISSNIHVAPAHEAYILQPVRYFKACAQHSDFLDRAQMMT